MTRKGGLAGRLLEEVETRAGYTVRPTQEVSLLEARSTAYGQTVRELDLLGWTVLDYVSGNPQELTPQARRQWVQQARMVWRQDPQAGAVVDLLNDFTLGRGVPKPRAKDEEVQKVIDEFWDDPDNQLVLTSYDAQLALNTDLTLQCNVFILFFDDGEDGKLQLALLNHDEVETVVRDPDNRLRALYYVAAKREQKWDFTNDAPKIDMQAQPKRLYFEHWRNLDTLRDRDGGLPDDLTPPKEKMGEGKVYHLAINRGSEEVFGNPSMRRLIRWFSAYNDFLSARVDMAQAAAAFLMKRKVKGTPNQVAKMAAKAISRRSELAGLSGTGPDTDVGPQLPPRPGSILTENEQVSHEQMKVDSGSGNAAQDAQMIRAAVSAGARFPQSYLGDATNSNLATATSLELPVLKAVENRQEILEGLFRTCLDRAIEKAVDSGKLSKTVAPEQNPNADPSAPTTDLGAPDDTGLYGPPSLNGQPQEARGLSEYDGEIADEAETERDLSYEFSMPSPLRRMMTDLVTAVANIAKTFDPNGTNMELNRVLLTIALGEGLEMQEPSDAVDRIFPDGYEDPAIAAAQAQAQAQQNPDAPPVNAGPPDPSGNPYGAQGFSQDYQNNGGQPQPQEGAITLGRNGEQLRWPLGEARYADLPEPVVRKRDQAISDADAVLSDELDVATAILGRRLNGTARTERG